MITKEEFLKALDIVNKYKEQLSNEYEEMNNKLKDNDFALKSFTKETLLSETNISVRAKNAIKSSFMRNEETKHLQWDYHCNAKIGDLENLSKTELMQHRNIGKKTIKEIESLICSAGVFLKQNNSVV
jgi:DNA-directed RNA polymerase alpha subunit